MIRQWWRRFRSATRWFVVAGWLVGCGHTQATIDPAPTTDAPVVVVEGQMSGRYKCESFEVEWDSRRTSMIDRLFDVLFLGAANGSK